MASDTGVNLREERGEGRRERGREEEEKGKERTGRKSIKGVECYSGDVIVLTWCPSHQGTLGPLAECHTAHAGEESAKPTHIH